MAVTFRQRSTPIGHCGLAGTTTKARRTRAGNRAGESAYVLFNTRFFVRIAMSPRHPAAARRRAVQAPFLPQPDTTEASVAHLSSISAGYRWRPMGAAGPNRWGRAETRPGPNLLWKNRPRPCGTVLRLPRRANPGSVVRIGRNTQAVLLRFGRASRNQMLIRATLLAQNDVVLLHSRCVCKVSGLRIQA